MSAIGVKLPRSRASTKPGSETSAVPAEPLGAGRCRRLTHRSQASRDASLFCSSFQSRHFPTYESASTFPDDLLCRLYAIRVASSKIEDISGPAHHPDAVGESCVGTGFANGVTNLSTGIEFGLQRASAALRTLRDHRGGWSLDGAHVGDPAEQTLHALTWARVAG